MGKVDVARREESDDRYPLALYDAVRPGGSSALAAEFRINAWRNSPEGAAWEKRKLVMMAEQKEARRVADLKEFDEILERARARQASETTAVVETAEVASEQADQVERVIGTV